MSQKQKPKHSKPAVHKKATKDTAQRVITDRDLKRASHHVSNRRGAKTPKYNNLNLSTPVKVILIVFVVVISLSMMIPSLAWVVAANNEQRSQQSTATGADDSDEMQNASVSDIDSRFQSLVSAQQQKVDADSSDLSALLNLGNAYMNWGRALLSSSQSSSDTDHIHEVYAQAISAFDRYLSQQDSDAVSLNRATAQYLSGDHDTGIASLVALTQKSPDYGPAWVTLGNFYELSGSTDDAKNAYNQAIAVEPNDEYGSKTAAQRALANIAERESKTSSAQQAQNSGNGDTTSSGATSQDLQNTLENASGTNTN